MIDVYFSNSEIDYNINQVNNSVTVEIEKQSSVTGVALFINNSDSVDYPITADNVSYGSSDVDTELNYIHSEFENINQDILAHATAINLLDTTKQDTLIPGDNITIENNVISASGSSVNIKSINVSITSNASGWFYLKDDNNIDLDINNAIVLMVYIPYDDSVVDAYTGHISTESSKWICKLVGINNNTVISYQVTKTLTILYIER